MKMPSLALWYVLLSSSPGWQPIAPSVSASLYATTLAPVLMTSSHLLSSHFLTCYLLFDLPSSGCLNSHTGSVVQFSHVLKKHTCTTSARLCSILFASGLSEWFCFLSVSLDPSSCQRVLYLLFGDGWSVSSFTSGSMGGLWNFLL